ncbi:TPA: hypothetical protein SIA26_000461 [Aeromonas bestiarum]|nr:hypothetical protein [Aeromonas bestiarum]
MKAHLERFNAFITEQKDWFELNLALDFAHAWDEPVWISGSKGTGWLRGNGKNTLRFDEINRVKGIDRKHVVANEYCHFMKAMLVIVYRGNNRRMSPSVAVATLMVLKRWYHSLVEHTGQNHPMYLTTEVIQRSMDILSAVSMPGDPNVANYKGRCVSLQKLVNHQSFSLVSLNYVSDLKYTNKTNLTRKAKETIALKHQERLDDSSGEDENTLITIRGFLNIVALIQRVESDAEKIALNCLLLLIVTGFRSVEAFNLRHNALIKRHVDDPTISARLRNKGLPDYFLGIKYVGVKGAGERTHWVEPLAVPLVENIFSAVKALTAPMREHLLYLREKSFSDYLPRSISALPGDMIELDDIVAHVAHSSTKLRGQSGLRDKASKALAKRGVTPGHEQDGPRRSKLFFYSKNSINSLIKAEFDRHDLNTPCTHSWVENGKRYVVNYEDLLFLYNLGSLSLKRTMVFKANPVPLKNDQINKFLGNLDSNNSIFSKYNLLEDSGSPTRLRTHIPRHNINTFLAIAEVSDHLQAMLMGRMDISQNHHYQHLALAERRKNASLSNQKSNSTELTAQSASPTANTTLPIDLVKQTGYIVLSDRLNLEHNIKANLHTFDNRDEVSAFIEASFNNNLFDDIATAFEEITNKEGLKEAAAMVARHATLHPLKFGSCMREIALWGCPYRMKCQSSMFCEHFTLTGRIDELPNLFIKQQMLQKAKTQLEKLSKDTPGYQKSLSQINKSMVQLNVMENKWLRSSESNRPVRTENLLSGDLSGDGKIKTLAQLFALEHKNIKKGE